MLLPGGCEHMLHLGETTGLRRRSPDKLAFRQNDAVGIQHRHLIEALCGKLIAFVTGLTKLKT
ncbi:hypothetical protein D3C81_843080 [compost metagenome]